MRKSVDSQSFFDVSDVFPVGGESGAQAKGHQRAAQAESAWRASEGLIANCWSRRTRDV